VVKGQGAVGVSNVSDRRPLSDLKDGMTWPSLSSMYGTPRMESAPKNLSTKSTTLEVSLSKSNMPDNANSCHSVRTVGHGLTELPGAASITNNAPDAVNPIRPRITISLQLVAER
jgi:hypothetical protein